MSDLLSEQTHPRFLDRNAFRYRFSDAPAPPAEAWLFGMDDHSIAHRTHQQSQTSLQRLESPPLSDPADSPCHPISHDGSKGSLTPPSSNQSASTYCGHLLDAVE